MELYEKVKLAGVVGAGGAGFPTHEKLKQPVDYLLVNAAECEPLLFSDQYVMQYKAMQVLQGIRLVTEAIMAKKVFFVSKKKYGRELQTIKKAVFDSGMGEIVEIVALDNFYPAGDEQILVNEAVGRIVPAGGIPLDVGCVVMNVTTLLQIAEADSNIPVTEKIVTVTGEVVSPSLLLVPNGISVSQCLEEAGGVTTTKYHVIIGGPLMGRIIDDVDAANTHLKKTDSALIVLPYNHYIVRRKKASLSKIINEARTACIQCRMCTDMCPRYLLGHDLQPHLIMRNIGLPFAKQELLEQSYYCCECGVCEMWACPMGLSPRLVNIHAKSIMREKGIKIKKQTGVLQSKRFAFGRKVPADRLIAKLNIMGYKKLKPMDNVRQVKAEKVVLAMKQHVGASAVPEVVAGEAVVVGQIIAKIKEGMLGANIHASIAGVVKSVDSNFVEILGRPE